jgi:uridine kinase
MVVYGNLDDAAARCTRRRRQAGRGHERSGGRAGRCARRVAPARSVLAALSGIDGSGKGFVAAQIAAALAARELRVASINIDGWLNLPPLRFSATDPAWPFYRHAIRFDALFAQLLLPLRERRSIVLDADFAAETATAFIKHRYAFDDVDVVLVEACIC